MEEQRPTPTSQWYQRPSEAGQAVDVWYSVDWENEQLFRKTDDRNGPVCLEVGRMLNDGSAFEPWNDLIPNVSRWTRLTLKE
jgi:hypothetical protein